MIKRIKHALIRRKANLKSLPFDKFHIRLATSTDDYAQAFNLVQVSYAALGIGHLGQSLYRMTEQHVLPEALVLLAEEQRRVVGTITVTLDSPAGLPLDKDYREILAPLRGLNAKLAEVGSYAVVQRKRHSGVAQLLVLCAHRLIQKHDCTHTIIGINPKVTPIYAATWGYQDCGDAKGHQNLHAPVSAMVLSRQRLRNHAIDHLGRHGASTRTLEDLLFGDAPIPNTTLEDRQRHHRMTRDTFQHLFMQESDHLRDLGPDTLSYVRKLRSDETLGSPTRSMKGSPMEPPKDLGDVLNNMDDRPAESGLMWLN